MKLYQINAIKACERLLDIAEESESGWHGGIADFMMSLRTAADDITMDLNLMGLCLLEREVLVDIMQCLKCVVLHRENNLINQVPNGHKRAEAIFKKWGVESRLHADQITTSYDYDLMESKL